MRWLALSSAIVVALALWTLTQARGELSITLEPLDDYCESTEQDAGKTDVKWTITGGRTPYQVWIAGELQQGTSGVATVSCVGLRGRDVWNYDAPKRSGPLNVIAIVQDADGVRASDLAWVERLVEVQPLRWVGGGGYGGEPFIGPGWFRVAGHTFWVPEGEWEADNHAESRFEDRRRMLSLQRAGLTIRLDRETGQELARDSYLAEAEYAATNAQVDEIVASVGNTPSRSMMTFDGSVDSLTLELLAPAVCEASRWDFSRRRYPFEYRDDVVAEVEWRVSGGQQPYILHIAEGVYQVASGRLRIPCQAFANGVADSGLISIPALVQDANGATGSGIVQTYAIARRSGGEYAAAKFMNGGRTYRIDGITMTIPVGLTIDISHGVSAIEVDCGANSCTSASCANELNANVCEGSFSLSSKSGSVGASFGTVTRRMSGRGWIREGWREDEGVSADSEAEIRELINEWADSVGKGPDLSAARWLNPAPLQISGYPESLTCDPHISHRERRTVDVTITVSGGAWVPTGIQVNGQFVGLARGAAQIRVGSIVCQHHSGWESLTLNVHDVTPDHALAEIELRVLKFPARYEDGSLRIRAFAGQSKNRHPTAYCEAGGKVLVTWFLVGLTEPLTVLVNGAPAEHLDFVRGAWGTNAGGHAWLECLDRPGWQAATLEAIDSSPTPQRVLIPVLFQALAEHPSGRSWSDLRSWDYPD